MEAYKQQFIEFMVDCQVLKFGEFTLKEYSCTADGKIEYSVELHKYDEDDHHGNYRYGLFHFVKE